MKKLRAFPAIDNIHALTLPAPAGHSILLSVNMFAVGNGPITLIDAGTKSPEAFASIANQLNALGFGWGDVERIILTHCHGDHVGLATTIIEAAGRPVDCFIHPEDKWRISKEECGGRVWDWDETVERFFIRANMPNKEIMMLRKHFDDLESMADPIENLSTMEDGQTFSGDGYRLKVVHTPGHSPGACCLYDPDRKILFSGDTVIKHFPPNAIMELKHHRLKTPNYQSLKAHLNSLEKLAAMDIRYVFSGHGEYVDDPAHLISTYFDYHQQMMKSIRSALGNGNRSIYDIVEKLFRRKTSGEAYFAVSEVTVHLEYLIAEGRVQLIDDGLPVVYRAI
ncbi:MAG: MBL fold metallo-hydrolase [Deltaproteobacteria bacterium]|nr:MBL fold metallo-hydrolase [Deltaproteobacteria bacterium]